MSSYLYAFSHLNTAQSRKHYTEATTYRAPHKPMLILCILDLIAQGNIQTNFIELNQELVDMFGGYWNLVMPSTRRANIAMPFFHLRSDEFWHLIPRPGYEQTLPNIPTISAIGKIHTMILGVKLDKDLFIQLQDPDKRSAYRRIIIETYFSTEYQIELIERGTVNLEAFQYSLHLLEKARAQQDTSKEEVKTIARDQGFRRAIVQAYQHRCAFCGIRMRTPDGYTAIVAAHIIPWSISHNDDPRNGLALCQLCHWAFDRGLMSVSGKYLVLASDYLMQTDNLPGHLITLVNRKMMGPEEEALWPKKDNLKWHRREIFL